MTLHDLTTRERRAIENALTMNSIVYLNDVGNKTVASLLRQDYIERIWPGAYRVTDAGRAAVRGPVVSE